MELGSTPVDFTKVLPEELSFAIFIKLGSKDLCTAAQVSSEVKIPSKRS
jgi:hypothetical protein